MKHRALWTGDGGLQWLTHVSDLLGDIERGWSLQIEEQLSGGTEALVFLVSRAGEPAVLKLGIPNSIKAEALTLQHADGHGYAKLLVYDESRDAMLLERLGNNLADSQHSIRQQIVIICETLHAAWRIPVDHRGSQPVRKKRGRKRLSLNRNGVY